MNEFQAVSIEEMSQVEGGKGFWDTVKSIGEKVVVGVLTALALKQVGKI